MPPSIPPALSFTSHLASLAEGERALPKGERTRLRIKAAAAGLLAARGYQSLVMLEIARAAALSNGAVYKHFENKEKLVIELLADFIAYIGRSLRGIPIGADPYDGFFEAYRCYVELYRQNAGLMRSLRQLSDSIPEVGQAWDASYAEWSGRLARIVVRDRGGSEEDHAAMAPLIRALASMGNEFLHDLIVKRSPDLAKLDQSNDAIAEMLATIFYRAACGHAPPAHAPPSRARRPHAAPHQAAPLGMNSWNQKGPVG